jgi:hypothetical protein
VKRAEGRGTVFKAKKRARGSEKRGKGASREKSTSSRRKRYSIISSAGQWRPLSLPTKRTRIWGRVAQERARRATSSIRMKSAENRDIRHKKPRPRKRAKEGK